MTPQSMPAFPGATMVSSDTCSFVVWAPLKKKMQIHFPHVNKVLDMQKDEEGYFRLEVPGISEGTQYFFRPDGSEDLPDPASAFQPESVHGPSEVVDHTSFMWNDSAWRGLPFEDLILYELHVGTFTAEGTFEAIIPRLDDLVEVGVNAIELMPVSQFSGHRNWGYDGVFPYAVQNTYGGPVGLKRLVNACHEKGIAVFLDVVYNHIGPEGNYFGHYGPYFTDKYGTPWGQALNFDGDYSDGVREYFANNALYWFEHYHLDGLRLDAVHMAFDNGAVHFWELVNEKIKALQSRLGRMLHTIAESDLNSPKVIADTESGGWGFNAQWLDDFHHALYVMLDENGRERYEDFGLMEQLVKAYQDGFVHSGEFVRFRKRKHGRSSVGVPGSKFVAFNLNHDQVGNRPMGERLCLLVDFERLKLAAAALFLSPYVPMLFMGEEYADRSPFFYFISHTDKALIEAVRKGRKDEFKDFKTEGESPDPYDEKTFTDCFLKWENRKHESHSIILEWHKQLIHMRRTIPALRNMQKNDVHAHSIGQAGLVLHRQEEGGRSHVVGVFNFSDTAISYVMPFYSKTWEKILDSRELKWLDQEKQGKVTAEVVRAGEEIKLLPWSVAVFHSDRRSAMQKT